MFAGFVARMEDTRLPKGVMFGEMVGGAGCVGGQEEEWMERFLDDLRAFGNNANQWTTAAQDEGEWHRAAEKGAEHFVAKWIATEKNKAGLRHTVVCSNVTEGPRRGWPKASGLVLVCSPLLTSHKGRELVPSGRLVCRCHDVFLWCYVCFVLLRLSLYVFVEAAALRLIVLRYTGAPIATRVFLFLFLLRCRFSRVFFVPFTFSLCMESTSYVLSFRMVFVYIVTTG